MAEKKYFISKDGFKDFLKYVQDVFGTAGKKYFTSCSNSWVQVEIDGAAIYHVVLELKSILENPIYKNSDKYFPVPSCPDVFIQKYICLNFDYINFDCLWFEMFCAARFVSVALMERSEVSYSDNFKCCYYDFRQVNN